MNLQRIPSQKMADSRLSARSPGSSLNVCQTRQQSPLSTSYDPQPSVPRASRKQQDGRRFLQRNTTTRVITPARSEMITSVPPPSALPTTDLLSGIVAPVKHDMNELTQNLRDVVGNRHPMLRAAADQIFGAGGKRLRPVLVFLVARATAELMQLR